MVPTPKFAVQQNPPAYAHAHGVTHNHGRPHAWPWQETLVIQMLTRDLFAVANLMVVHIDGTLRVQARRLITDRQVPVTTPIQYYPTHRQLRLVHH